MKRSMVFILFFISTPVLLSTRVIQQLYMIDPITGFYQDSFAGIGTAISIMCFALIFITLALVWLSHPQAPIMPRRHVGLGISACFAAACLILKSAVDVLSNSGSDKIIGLLGFASAMSLACYGAALLSGAKYPSPLTVLPILYAITRLVLDFIKYTGEVTVTDTVFSIITMCLVLLFFYTSGKLISGVGGKNTHILFYSFGLCAAFFCADSIFVRIILSFTHSSAALHGSGKLDVACIGFAVYIVTAVWVLSDRSRKLETADSEPITESTEITE